MNRRTFDKIVSFIGLGLALLLFTFAGLLNFGASFANESVKTQLENQNIAFPAEDSLPADTKEQLTKWAGKTVNTGEMADLFTFVALLWKRRFNPQLSVSG